MTDYEFDPSVPLDGPASITAAFDNMEHLQRSSLVMYRIHRDSQALEKYRLLTYRCHRRCLLLDVFRTPAGPAVYFPPFKLSPEQNERSAPDARTERTSDGVRRWVERAELLSVFRSGLYLELNCDHVSRHVLTGDAITDAMTTRPGTTIAIP